MSIFKDLSREQKLELTQTIMVMLDDWGLSNHKKMVLLDLPTDIKIRTMRRFYEDVPFPEHTHVLERVDHLLGIADALRTSFPLNSQMTSFWLNKTNPRFNNQTPLDYMLDGGINNVVAIRTHLDCAWDWRQDNDKASE